MSRHRKYVLSIDPLAMERCFLTAKVLFSEFGLEYTEYGLVGLSEWSKPFHVIRTLLLPGQKVTSSSVYQSGHDVMRLRREIECLSQKIKKKLIPITFIHRHPGFLGLSFTDITFIKTTFIDHISSCIALPYKDRFWRSSFTCKCEDNGKAMRGNIRCCNSKIPRQYYHSVCFSIIVARESRFSIDAVHKIWCASCGYSSVDLAPAKLVVRPYHKVTSNDRRLLMQELEPQIREKLHFGLVPFQSESGVV